MVKKSKKRRRDSSSSDDEYSLRIQLKQLKKRLRQIDRERSPSPSHHRYHSRTLSQSPPSLALTERTKTDDLSSRRSQTPSKDRFENDSVYDSAFRETENLDNILEDSRNPDIPTDSQLNETVLSILGHKSAPLSKSSPPLRKEVAVSWLDTIQSGLKDEERISLIEKYPMPENCKFLEAPKLNPEVAAASREVVVRRDTKIADLQNQIGTALSALGQLLTKFLKEGNESNDISNVTLLSDASRLLLDFHTKQSRSRRELISLDLKKEVKETLSNVQVDEWLFGDKLGERLKASKEMERSGLELKSKPKITKKNAFFPNIHKNNLNSRRPPRQQRGYQSGRRQTQYPNTRTNVNPKNYRVQNQERKKPTRGPTRSRDPKGREVY